MAKRGSEEFKQKIGVTVAAKYATDPIYKARHLAGIRRYHEQRRKRAMELLKKVEQGVGDAAKG